MDDSRNSDAHLMSALREGDTSVMSLLVERWQGRLLAFVFRYVQNEATARDLVEETFVRVYLYRERYDPGRNFSTWMFGVAANLCRNHYRWRRRRPETSLEEAPEQVASADPARQADRRERDRALTQAVLELPHGLRVAILLYYFEEMPYAEIAKVLSCSVRGVESRLYRARKRLARKLRLPPSQSAIRVPDPPLLDPGKLRVNSH